MGFFRAIGDGLFGGDPLAGARRQADEEFELAIAALEDGLGRISTQNQAGLDLLRQAFSSSLGDIDTAIAGIRDSGRTAGRRVLEREDQVVGDIMSSLRASGLDSSTVLGGVRRGVAADTSRALQDIDDSTRNALTGALFNRAGFNFDAAGAIAGFGQRGAGLEASQLGQIAATRQNREIIPDTEAIFGRNLVGGLLGVGLGAGVQSFFGRGERPQAQADRAGG